MQMKTPSKSRPMHGGQPARAEAKPPSMAHAEAAPDGGGDEHMQVHDHGDGTFHTVTKDGQETQHPHIGHMLMHIAHQHAPEHMHSHVQHNAEGGHTSHHVGLDGEPQGPHDHENLDALKSHMDQFLNEEGHEGAAGAGSMHEEDGSY